MSTDASLESYLLLLLSDSNLPTGGFVASSSLESYVQHGLLSSDGSKDKPSGILNFVRKSCDAYARLNLAFVAASHARVAGLSDDPSNQALHARATSDVDAALESLIDLDQHIEAMTLNHVARRASTAQGVALLTLYERALAPVEYDATIQAGQKPKQQQLVQALRTSIRAGKSFGHLPLGFGVLTSALGMSLGAAQHLFMFLHARSLLSSGIRLNIVGPYVAHRMLLHDVRPIVQATLEKYGNKLRVEQDVEPSAPDERLWWKRSSEDEDQEPATTWPLAEILAARHDQLHSKIFNS
ncbi:hypothetical protein OIV83_006012 [Microbotryomycetes sp. JL201]|nr:hypothetical protein OIV83_006012 [Microbotryomycetes sp. JL201]